jgi:hypothetical protein
VTNDNSFSEGENTDYADNRNIEEVIIRYNQDRELDSSGAIGASSALEIAERENSAIHYTLAGVLCMTSGDLCSAIQKFSKALDVDNSFIFTHLMLGVAHFRLAVFDMLNRGLCEIEMLERNGPFEETQSVALNVLRKELLASGRPKAYRQALAAKGYTQEDQITGLASAMLETLNKNGRFYPEWKSDLTKVINDLGQSQQIPIPRFTVDEAARQILILACKEFEMGGQGTVVMPSGWTIMREEEIKATIKTTIILLTGQIVGSPQILKGSVIHMFGLRLVEIALGSAAGVTMGMIFNVMRNGEVICKISIANVGIDKSMGTALGDVKHYPEVGDSVTARVIK